MEADGRPEQPERAAVKKWLAAYNDALAKRPLLTKSITSALVSLVGEVLQSIAKRERLSPRRCATFAAYGGLFVGPVMHFWYGFLERTCRKYGSGTVGLILRIVWDRLIMGPPFIAATIFIIKVLLSGRWKRSLGSVRAQFGDVFTTALKIWTPAQVVNFRYVPVAYRVLYGNLVAVSWNVYLASRF